MSFQSKTNKLKDILFNLNNVACKSEYLFIYGHIRSRSSVLSHILGSNNKIIGYSEQQCSYRNYNSLLNMRINLSKEFNSSFKNKILLDKLLHNKFFIDDSILKHYHPKILFLIRQPKDTFRSIINLGRKFEIKPYQDQKWILKYYNSRLDYLKNISSKLDDFFFIESDDLINKQEIVLGELANWLNLEEPLHPSYNTFLNTGKRLFGDPSENIKKGKLINTQKHADITISPAILNTANRHYFDCKEIFHSRKKY